MGERIKRLRLEKGLTQEELGNRFGLKRAAINKYEKGNVENMKRSIIEEMSNFFQVSPSYLMALDETESSIESIYNKLEPPRQAKVYSFAEAQLKQQNKKVVPLYGATAANPIELAYGDVDLDTTVETSVPDKADCALVVKGNSMEPEYQDGDIVFYKAQPTVENGEMAIVEIEGTGVTLKKVYMNYDDNKIILRSLNDDYDDRELEPEKVRILGKVVK
ncbi:LexA family protein [Enterococcus sp. HY326]|uniref:LexA family protein n=1 Tax=Enterococcus sp. HY326 TaxID=2971265 RepID=UPI00223F92CA|nr:XRE family transcriptional regulator [Enterococcus sp. HY326]